MYSIFVKNEYLLFEISCWMVSYSRREMGLAGNRILDGTIGEHMALNISLFQKKSKAQYLLFETA